MSRRWLDVEEQGGVWGLRFVVWACRLLGRRVTRLLLAPIVLYYALVNRRAVVSSRNYLLRVQQPAGFWDVYRHLLCFAQCSTDRFFLLAGQYDLFEVSTNGRHHLDALHAAGRGAVLLGAHLGSFEAMRAAAREHEWKLHIVGYFHNARRINAVLSKFAGNAELNLIDLAQPPTTVALKLKEAVERGELVAILADRSLGNKTVGINFLGGRAQLPIGPYVLASVLKCPVYLVFGLHYAPNRYSLFCEPFADCIHLPRGQRSEAVAGYAQAYAARVEHFCKLAPDNWFNFFDFWSDSHAR